MGSDRRGRACSVGLRATKEGCYILPRVPKQEASSGQSGLSPTASTVPMLVLKVWVSSLDRVSLRGRELCEVARL